MDERKDDLTGEQMVYSTGEQKVYSTVEMTADKWVEN
jgi:hypothetical protein